MRFKKVYGKSKQDFCAFCNKVATQKNETGLLVCRNHLSQKMEEIKCTCGSWLEQKSGKFGPYFTCVNCGNVNFSKAMEMKELMSEKDREAAKVEEEGSEGGVQEEESGEGKLMPPKKNESFEEREKRVKWSEKKERTITTDDLEYFS